MAKIKYNGPGSKVIAGRHVFHGETSEVNDKLVSGLRGDPDIEFLEEVTPAQEVEPISQPQQAEIMTPPPVETSKKVEVVAEPSPVRKPRSRKK